MQLTDLYKDETKSGFALTCFLCHSGEDVLSEQQAASEGWINVHADDGAWWNHIGLCPCRDELHDKERAKGQEVGK